MTQTPRLVRLGSLPPYPERFELVAKVAGAPDHEGVSSSNDGALLMFALYMQAMEGKCTMEQPSMFSLTEYTKWKCWDAISHLGKMEAMRRYVQTVEEEMPTVWDRVIDLDNSNTPKDESAAPAEGQTQPQDAAAPNTTSTTPSTSTPAATTAPTPKKANPTHYEDDPSNGTTNDEVSTANSDPGMSSSSNANQKAATTPTPQPTPNEVKRKGMEGKRRGSSSAAEGEGGGVVPSRVSSRFPETSREVGALLSALQVVEKNPESIQDYVPSTRQLLEDMLSTKALLDHAEAEMKSGCAEEEKLKDHLKAINPTNTSVEPDSGSFSPDTLRTSKQRSEALVHKGQTCINEIKEHVEMWRKAIQEELEASATGHRGKGSRRCAGGKRIDA